MRRLLAAAVILVPAAVSLLLPALLMGSRLDAYTPAWSDEIVYWHSALTFSQVGFDGGYYTHAEQPAPAAFSHFDTHGPWFSMLLGGIARLAGWYPQSVPFLNLLLLTAALALFVWFTRPDARQLLFTGLLMLVFWPVLLYAPSSMQEGLHQAAAVALAGLFFIRLTQGENTPRRVLLAAAALIALVALLRLTWALLFLPLLAYGSGRARQVRLLLAGAGFVAAFLLFQWLGAPYPYNFTTRLLPILAASPAEGLSIWLRQFVGNLRRLTLGEPLEIALRFQVFLLVAALLIGRASASRALVRARRWLFGGSRLPAGEAGFHLVNLGLLLTLNLALYDIFAWRDYRVLAPHLLLSALLLIAFRRLRLAGLLIATGALLLPAFLATYRDLHRAHFNADRAEIAAFASTLEAHVRYQPGAPNAWCNTILTDDLPPLLLGIPPGVGFSVDSTMALVGLPPRSRYLLLKPENAARAVETAPLRRLESLPERDLYLNETAECAE
ncbi:MAG: hypothetical protein DWB42_09985 [Chloroflexi bacterium]|nr:hypothetical protein [Chloroflexota bacterium]MDL1884373.1 hypothetical protein [Anaerolineae bacterium CFX8]